MTLEITYLFKFKGSKSVGSSVFGVSVNCADDDDDLNDDDMHDDPDEEEKVPFEVKKLQNFSSASTTESSNLLDSFDKLLRIDSLEKELARLKEEVYGSNKQLQLLTN